MDLPSEVFHSPLGLFSSLGTLSVVWHMTFSVPWSILEVPNHRCPSLTHRKEYSSLRETQRALYAHWSSETKRLFQHVQLCPPQSDQLTRHPPAFPKSEFELRLCHFLAIFADSQELQRIHPTASVLDLLKVECKAGSLSHPCFSLCLQPTHSVDC